MDGKLNYCRIVPCKKPHEKRANRREIAISVKVSKMVIFRKTAKRGPRKIIQNWAIFQANFGRQKKQEIQAL